jgi:sensor c-di-GMP phosphodiesterase-like protein
MNTLWGGTVVIVLGMGLLVGVMVLLLTSFYVKNY